MYTKINNFYVFYSQEASSASPGDPQDTSTEVLVSPTDPDYTEQLYNINNQLNEIYIIMFIFFFCWYIFRLKSVIHKYFQANTREMK